MNVQRRRGACPALSAPMETGDGLLVRLTPWDGALSCAALAGLAGAARDFGNGILEVTARGNLQLRGLSAETIGRLNTAVNALGIRAREGLAINISPLAGLDACERADARPLADAIRAGVAAAGLAPRLGPKVSVVIDGAGTVSLDTLKADMRLKARDDGAWALSLAGDAKEAASLHVVDGVEAAELVVGLLSKVAALGLAGRMTDLIEAKEDTLSRPGLPLAPPNPRPVLLPSFHALGDATIAIAIALPFGVADSGMMGALASAAARHGARDLRPAPPRILLAVGLSQASALALAQDAEQLGFITDPADPRLSVAACPGAPTCASGRIAARTIAPEIAHALAPLLDGSVSVHVSGCAKGCARPAAATLTIVGCGAQSVVEGMDSPAALVRQGNAASPPDAFLPPHALVAAFTRLAALAVAEKRAGENAAQCLSRLDLAAMLEPSA